MTNPSLSSSTASATPGAVSAVRGAIAAANAAFSAAFARGDAAAIAACYTPDAQLLPAQSNVIGGRPAIEEFWRGALGMGLNGATLETVEVFHSSGAPTATEVGRYTLTTGDGQVADRGKYIVVWQQDGAGQWHLHRDIWTTSQAPAATA